MTDTQQFLQLAIRQINIGNPGAAILPLHRVLASDPQHPLAHAHLAHSLRETGQAAEARREIAMARPCRPRTRTRVASPASSPSTPGNFTRPKTI